MPPPQGFKASNWIAWPGVPKCCHCHRCNRCMWPGPSSIFVTCPPRPHDWCDAWPTLVNSSVACCLKEGMPCSSFNLFGMALLVYARTIRPNEIAYTSTVSACMTPSLPSKLSKLSKSYAAFVGGLKQVWHFELGKWRESADSSVATEMLTMIGGCPPLCYRRWAL